MTDDDLTRDLEAWAAATDPDADPITAAEVTEAPAIRVRRARRPILAVAAALLVVLGLGAAVVSIASDDDEPAEIATDTTSTEPAATGPRTQIVVVGPDLDTSWWRVAHRFSLIGPDGQGVTGPLLPGTSLIVDQPLTPGRWDLSVLSYDCTAAGDDGCGAPNIDGTPSDGAAPTRCEVPLEVGPTADRWVIAVTPEDDGTLRCAQRATDAEPELTVPPGWSVRAPLPWGCGSATHDINGQVAGSDSDAAIATLTCFQEALAAGTPVEIPTVELQSGDGLTRSWWRVLPEPIDGQRIEVLRDQGLGGVVGWARILCDDIRVETTDVEPIGDGGEDQHVSATPIGCLAEEPLPLDLPPLDGPTPTPPPTTTPTTTTTAPPADDGSGVDLVITVDDLPQYVEGGLFRWDLAVDPEGAPTWSGQIAREGTLLVLADVPVEVMAEAALRWSEYACPGACPNPGDGGRPFVGPEPVEGFTAGAPLCTVSDLATLTDGDVVVLSVSGGGRCAVEVRPDLPPLSAPPSWSTRTPAEACGIVLEEDVGPRREEAAFCFTSAHEVGVAAEAVVRLAGENVILRTDDGVIQVVREGERPGDPWATTTCAGVAESDEPPYLEPTDCGEEQEMPLTP